MERRASRLAIGFSCAGHAYMHVLTGLYLTIVLGLERDWSIAYDELIGLWTLGSLAVGLGAPLAGWLGDRWSESRMMVIFFLVTGLGSVIAGLMDGPAALTMALVVLGLGASIYHPVGTAWVIRNAAKRGQALGVVGVFGSIGVATAALIAAFLTERIGWRAAFVIPGIVCMLTGMALAACIALGLVVDRNSDAVAEAPAARGDMVRAFVALSVTMACGGIVFNALLVALPKWFEARMPGLTGGGMLGVGGLVSATFFVGAASLLLGGRLADRVEPKLVYLLGLGAQAILLALAGGLTELPLLASLMLAVFVGNALLPAENVMLAQYTPARHRGLAYGAKFVLAFGLAPLSVQLVAMSYGQNQGFALLAWILGALGLVAWVAAFALPGRIGRAPGRAVAAAAE